MARTGILISGFHHDTGPHPENAGRLSAIEAVCQNPDIGPHLEQIQPRAATFEELCEVHDGDYIKRVEESCKGGVRALDPDTIICPRSYDEALRSAGGVLAALNRVLAGDVRNAFCAVRPPGHHAERDRAMGFCLWDVHHGNGTQNSFYADPSVFYFSIHQVHHYPGTGNERQEGKEAGAGCTRNVPLPAGSGDREYLEVLEKVLLPAMESFHPELILISAGFDAHRDDPLAGMNVTENGFGEMTDLLKRLADEYCAGRLISMLEGGYNLEALQKSVRAHLLSLIRSE
jgi:acetoin utilization deacetylase AcuC-like enzyme